MSVPITRDEWLKAVGDAVMPCDPDAITVRELAEMLNVDHQAAYKQIRRLLKEGKAVPSRKRITHASGQSRTVAAYKLVSNAARPATRRR